MAADCLGACQWSAATLRTARCGVRFDAGLEAADRDDLVPRPDPDGEGTGSMPQDTCRGPRGGGGEVGRCRRGITRRRGRAAAHLAARPLAGYWNCAWAKKKQEYPSI
jgi:hypothetical protein